MPADWWPGLRELFDDLDFEDKIIKYAALGVNYTNNNWILKSELAIYDVHCCLIGDLGYGYISLGYESGEFTPYVTFAATRPLYGERQLDPPNYAAIPDPAYQQLLGGVHQLVQATYDSTRMEQQSLSVGFRWDFMANWALKAQASRYQLKAPGFGLWGSEKSIPIVDDRYVIVLSVNLNTVF